MLTSTLLALAASWSTASAAVFKGFNYAAAADFENDFKTAKSLVGTSGFSSARLYTMIKPGTPNTPTDAIQAAINTQTTLLLGLWASVAPDAFNNELAALRSAISQYGSAFTDLIVGVSVGSEDLYRLTPLGASIGAGQEPDRLVSYIGQVRSVLANAQISPPVGHVDTYTAWINSSNAAVTAAVDFLGMDAYPYYQNTINNSIGNANATFFSALDQTTAASTGKPVWITETGWPVSGPTDGQAVASIQNAQAYWDAVGCSVFGKYNTWWYTLQDAPQPNGNPSFGVVGAPLSTTPLYSLTCEGSSASASSHSGSSSAPSPSSHTSASRAGSTSVSASSALSSSISTSVVPLSTGLSSQPTIAPTPNAAILFSVKGRCGGMLCALLAVATAATCLL